MKKAILGIANYFASMNSEGTKISIKRNISWALLTLEMFVQIYSIAKLNDRLSTDQIIDLCKFYTIADGVQILLILGITSLEKVQSLVQTIKGGYQPQQPEPAKPETPAQ